MTRGKDFIEKGSCENKPCSSMSNSARCDLNSKRNILKLHDKCPNPKCNCRKQITFTPKQYMLEGNCFKNTMQKLFEGSQSAWNKFLKSVNVAATFIGLAVSAKTKNQKVGLAAAYILKSISGGKVRSLTDMHCRGFRLKVM